MTRESRSSSASETARRTGAALAEVARLLARSLDPDVVARLVADSVRSLLGGQPSVVYRLDRESGNLVSIAISGDPGPGFGDRVVIPPGGGSVGVAVATRRPFTTEDLLADPRITFDEAVRTGIAQGPFRSALAVPLLVKDQVIGALFLGDVAGRAFTEDDVRLAEAFADQAAVALNNAHLYDALTIRATRLRTLAELNRLVSSSLDLERVLSAIARAAAELTGARLVSCWIADEATQTLERAAYSDEALGRTHPIPRVRFGEGGIGWVAVHRQPLDLPDLAAFGRMAANDWFAERGLRSGLELPIVFQGRLLGVLAHFAATPFRLDADDRDLLDNFVAQAAIALRNAQLYEEAQQGRRDAEAAERRASLIAHEVEATSRAKDEFLAMLGHELRNPLGAISHAVHVLERLGATDEGSLRARGVVMRQVQHLTTLVDDLLDVARVTTGKIVLNRGPVDLSEIARQCVSTLGASGRSDRHRVTCDARPTWIDADATRVEQIVTNLLVNALKYTPAGGAVDVTVRPADGEAVLEVRDSGIGIASDVLPRIFEVFVQGERALDRAQGGLGVGLTLVRRLVELHGGRVEAASDGAGRGSRFTVRLPLAAGPSERTGAAATRHGEGHRRILLVEDNADAREMLRQLLALDGHEVHEARDGPGGVTVALEVQPDVALIDLGLPGLDGWEVARRIRAARGGGEIFLVALTGYGQPEDHGRSRDAGFDAHLVKPVGPADLARIFTHAPRRLPAA